MGLWRAWIAGREGRRNRRAARAAARALLSGGPAPRRPGGLALELSPTWVGDPGRGRALLAGRLRLAGEAAALEGAADPWALRLTSAGAVRALHGHGWLDDLAAAGGRAARGTAQAWVAGWLERHGEGRGLGRGPAWAPAATGRRLRAWLEHAPWLLAGPGRAMAPRLGASAAVQAGFLARRWAAAPPGPERFEALAGLVLAALAVEGAQAHLPEALAALETSCDGLVDAEGALAGRNPEELLEVFLCLTGAAAALRAARREPQPAHAAAIARIAPTLKALRHADGGLARFHGGGAGPTGALDLALAEAGVRARPRPGRPMGFVRLAARRTTVLVDAAAPPEGPLGHASTLAFELTSGRRPLIVSAGSGAGFGAGWRRHGRGTAAHATLELEGASSSRLGRGARLAAPETEEPGLQERPAQVTLAREGEGHAAGVLLSHDGWAASHGLVHMRRLGLSADGRMLMGEDALIATTPAERRRFAAVAGRGGLPGIGFAVRFPLHPDVEVALDGGGREVAMRLRSGELWRLRPEGVLPMLEPAVYFDPARDAPRPTRAIVLAGRATAPVHEIGWTLAKAEDTPVGLRDVALDEEVPA